MLKCEKSLPDLSVLFLARLFRKVDRENGSDPLIAAKPDELISIQELESNYDKLTPGQQGDIGIFLSKFQAIWGRKFPLPFNSARKMLDLVAAIKNNQFAICDEEKSTTELGSGIYLNASLLNHSCEPNAVPLFSGLKLYVKALKKINAGEEICISYTDTSAITSDRRTCLEDIYRFKCCCIKCCSDFGTAVDLKKMSDLKGNALEEDDPAIKSVKVALSDLDGFRKNKDWKLMAESAKGWLARKMLPDHNIFWVRLNEFAFDAGIETHDWELALKAAGSIIPAYKEYFGANHPTLGITLMKFGKILSHLEKYKEAEEYFRSAFGILSLFYPPESKIRADLHQLVLETFEKTPQ